LIQLRALGVGHGSCASALIGLLVDSNALPLAYCHNKHQHLAIPHFVDQAETSGAELDLVAMTGAPQLAGGNPRFDQPFVQRFLELLPDPCAQGPPFPQGLGMKASL
jgi:hypothetical protein